jgi:hypothetical protein
MSSIAVTKSITAQNTFTDPVQLTGNFNLSISGTFSATVTVQRSSDNSTWRDVDTFTAPSEEVGYEPEVMWYRAGVKTGGFTSGTADVRLGYDPQQRLS